MSDPATVLVVDDDEAVASTFEEWLDASGYDTVVSTGGEEALDVLADRVVDVALLDRRMPGLSGDEVLDRIHEEGYGCRTAMVTAVEPDFDIVDMGFDAYVTKPSSPDELRGTVEELLELDKREEDRREYASLCIKRATLEEEKTEDELERSEEYTELLSRIEELEGSLDDTVSDEEFRTSLRDLDG